MISPAGIHRTLESFYCNLDRMRKYTIIEECECGCREGFDCAVKPSGEKFMYTLDMMMTIS